MFPFFFNYGLGFRIISGFRVYFFNFGLGFRVINGFRVFEGLCGFKILGC